RMTHPAPRVPSLLRSWRACQSLCPTAATLAALAGCWLLGSAAATAAPSPFSDEATLRSVTFIDADRGWCVGDFGVILRSEDSGLSWQPLDSSTTANLNAVGM